MKTILCYGDSNTWGYNPETFDRYPYDVRWTGRLQAMLSDCRVLECGLNGRTTAFSDPLEPGRNGLKYLPIALKTHDPIDLMLLMLGTNDCKCRHGVNAEEIALGMERLILTAQAVTLWGGRSNPRILVIAPPRMDMNGLEGSPMAAAFDKTSEQKSRRLAACYAPLCKRLGVDFFDAGTVVPSMGPIDGTHLSADGHAALAQALAGLIPTLL